jgi:serine/threonine protein phosphatase PrpC
MNGTTELILFGRDHGSKGGIFSRSLDGANVALATSAGVTSKPNEDAVGACVFGRDLVLAVADGHWGREASEIAVSEAVKILRSNPVAENETRARLVVLFEQVNNQLYEMAASTPGSLTPETTLIVCHIQDGESKYLYWSSFGDSYLFLFRAQLLKQLNTLQPRWLGYLSSLSEKSDSRAILMRLLTDEARYVGVAGGLETGIETLEPGDVILLCTDGMVGSDREPDPVILNGISSVLGSDGSAGVKVENLIAAALERQEKDNISCVVALIP